MKHKPQKRFGQNFLTDSFTIDRILQVLAIHPEDSCVEVGPGLGALTKPLLKAANRLKAIEIDKNLLYPLSQLPNAKGKLEVIQGDALQIDYTQFGSELRLIGNLPYNISTPLLFHFMQFKNQLKDMHFMLQKEVVLRLAAQPNTKDYGQLSILMQYQFEVDHLFDVPAEAFYPPPKVESAFVRLRPHKISPYAPVPFDKLKKLVQQAFSMRRKTLFNNLKTLMIRSDFEILGIEPSLRPEQLSIENFVIMVNYLSR